MTKLPDAICDRVRNYVAEHDLLHEADAVYVGFSGGADSTFLLLVMRDLHPATTAVHLNHGLRGSDADRDEAWCRDFCRRRQLPLVVERLRVPDRRRSGEGDEEAARRCRLEFWQEFIKRRQVVALGHHRDDCLEEFLLRAMRGANATGLTALRAKRCIAGVRYIRPLLNLRDDEIRCQLRRAGVENWCEDRTNTDIRYRRNMLRHNVLPLLRESWGHDRGLLRTLDTLAEDADYLESQAEQHLNDVTSADRLRNLHPALLPRVLRLWLRKQTGQDTVPTHHTLMRLREALDRKSSGLHRIPCTGETEIILDRDGLRIATECAPLSTQAWHWRDQPVLSLPEAAGTLRATCCTAGECIVSTGKWTECFDRAALPEMLTVRGWQPGDRLVPFGRRQEKKVKALFNEAGIPADRRCQIPVVEANDRIIWIPGVKRAEFGRVGPEPGGPAVRLSFRRPGCNGSGK